MNEPDKYPQDNEEINPDEVRINKLEIIIEEWFEYRSRFITTRKANIEKILRSCLNDINIESHTEHYTNKEIKESLTAWFDKDDIIEFLLKDYMEAMNPQLDYNPNTFKQETKKIFEDYKTDITQNALRNKGNV